MSRPTHTARTNSTKSRARLTVVRSEPSTPIEEFVEAMAIELGLSNGSSDQRTRRQLLRLTQWATAEGMALDREVILDPDAVERFIASLAEERSAATHRAVLRRVGPLLTKRAPWEPRAQAIPRRQLAPPYENDEVSTLIDDAIDQPNWSRQRAAIAFLTLGLGAGLDGRWVTRVAASHVRLEGDVVTVEVGEPRPRKVVCLVTWEEQLLGLAATAQRDEFLVGGYSTSKNRTAELTARLAVPTGHPRLSPARLRSTWLLWHLDAGTRLPELCRAAGLQGTQVLGDLLAYAEPLCALHAAQMLRVPGT
jgi:hypothetical protein